jgi:tetratricopeptide (TPR) repeat protein
MLLTPRQTIFLLAALCLSPVTVMAQVGTLSGMDVEVRRFVQGRVTNATGDPMPGVRVDIMTNTGMPAKTLSTDPHGEFQTDYFLHRFTETEFIVTLLVEKKGYPKAHVYFNYGKTGKPLLITVVLHAALNDATLLSQDDLIKGLAPKLRTVEPSDGLSSKDAKTFDRGAAEFLDRNRLDFAVPLLDKVVISNPTCLRCRLMMGLADLSWGDWSSAERHLGEAVNAVLANPKLGRPEPLVAYGVLRTWAHDPEKAEPYFYEALKYAPQDALALQELGRVQCLTLNWDGAADSEKKAIAAGAGPEAHLLLAQALVWSGAVKDADAELNKYLNGRDVKKMPPWVNGVWARIQARKKDDNALVKLQKQDTPVLDYVHNPPPELLKVAVPGNDADLPGILSAAGEKVAEGFNKFPNTSSMEVIHQERLDRNGKGGKGLDQKYRYLCLAPAGKWGPQTDEYRADVTGHQASLRGLKENYMLTGGFVASSLIFHPAYQSGSTFRLLGRQKVKGRDAHVVVFAQVPGRSRMYGEFKAGKETRETYFQGVAWIDTTTHQILRLKTDLLTPLPIVKLQGETTNIEYNEVHFDRIPEAFWLPAQVTVTLDWRGEHLRNRHEYSDFVVFNVESLQRIAKPKGAPPDSEGGVGPKATP